MRPDLWERSVVLSSDTSSKYAKHLSHIILKSFYAWGNYNLDTKANKHLNCKCDLELWDRGVILPRDMSSLYAKHLC